MYRTKEEVIAAANAGDIDLGEAAQLLAEMKNRKPLRFKLQEEKGTISVYGLGRFPTTLYPNQWERFFEEIADELKEYIETNRDHLNMHKG